MCVVRTQHSGRCHKKAAEGERKEILRMKLKVINQVSLAG